MEILNKVRDTFENRSRQMNHISTLTGENAAAPAIFVFIGERAAARQPIIAEYLKKRWDNAENVIYFNINNDSSFMNGVDKGISRKELHDKLLNNDEFKTAFNNEVIDLATKIKHSSFQKMQNAYVFFVTYCDEKLNALLPEAVMLLKKKMEGVTLINYLFNSLDEKVKSENTFDNISFMKEMEEFHSPTFSCSLPIDKQGEFCFDTEQNGPVFNEIFCQELYRQDGLFCENNDNENAYVIAAVMYLINRRSPYNLVSHSRGKILAAGYSAAEKPNDIIAHCIYSTLFDSLTGINSEPTEKEKKTLCDFLSEETVNEICDRVLADFPIQSDAVLSVVPNENISPASIRNTNVGSILSDFFHGADMDFYENQYEKPMIKSINCDRVLKFLINAINNGDIAFSSATAMISPENIALNRLRELMEQFKNNEIYEKQQIVSIENEIISIPRGCLFSKKPNGCDIVAAAVKLKYNAMYNVTLCKLKQAVVKKWIDELNNIYPLFTRAHNILSDRSAKVKKSIADSFSREQSSLVTFDVMENCYHKVATEALEACKAEGGFDISVCDYIFTNDKNGFRLNLEESDSSANGMKVLEKETARLFALLLNQQSVSKIFGMNYDEELYFRYGAANVNENRVNEDLYQKLNAESSENLRFTVLDGDKYKQKYCIGNDQTKFVNYIKGKISSNVSLSSQLTLINIGQKTIYEQISLAGEIGFENINYFKSYNELIEKCKDSYIRRCESDDRQND